MKKQHVGAFFMVVLLIFSGWSLFILDIGGRSLASHGAEVWRSKVVQDKVDFVLARLGEKIDAQVKMLDGERPRQRPSAVMAKAKPDKPEKREHETEEADRKSLDDLLSGSHSE
jgi:hypothetical protein